MSFSAYVANKRVIITRLELGRQMVKSWGDESGELR